MRTTGKVVYATGLIVTQVLLLLVVYRFFLRDYMYDNQDDEEMAVRIMSNENDIISHQHHPQWKSSVYQCEREINPQLYKSQSEEDKELLHEWFGGLCNGTYAEMGALGGIKYSNSFVFNKALDWKGVLVEIGPSNYNRLVRNRRNELATVHAGVCDKKQTLHYIEQTNVGGILEFMAPSFMERWFKKTSLEEAKQDARSREVECLPLKDIFEDAVGDHFFFDFFSLDIEGAEFMALSSLDFDKVGFGVIFVEADEHNLRKNWALRALLEKNGYTFVQEKSRSYWFVNKDFDSIYKDVLHRRATNSTTAIVNGS